MFTIEHNTWKRVKNLDNAKNIVANFKGRLSIEVRRQEKIDIVEK